MCGIAGIAGEPESFRAEQAVARMVASLARRGPDGEGVERWPDAVLGHRRLAIFDLSEAGRQPMISRDRTVGLVFNGAIYNFKELRRELSNAGHEFQTRTDTEVLLHGYREWGMDELLRRVRGMYAIALWDDRARKLFLVRDRLGVKPLVYSAAHGRIAFASTVRALRDSGYAGEIDDQAVVEFLEFGYVTDDRTIYRGVSKLAAGELVEWSGDEMRVRRYWSPPDAETSDDGFSEAVDRTEELLLNAVRRRMEADVRVGALLSGGVDSSLACWAITKLGGDIKAFTVGTPGDAWDETADAVATARTLGIDHEVIEIAPGDAPEIDELTTAYGEPFACASALGMLQVSRAIKPCATVLITGDGGDDVFLGYPEHKHLWMAQRVARAMPSGAAALWRAVRPDAPPGGVARRATNFLNYATEGLSGAARAHDGLPFYQRRGLFGERIAARTVAHREIKPSLASARNLMPEFLAYDRATRFVGEYMTKVDGATMHYALEARSPFLDQDLWEYAAALPVGTRLHGGQLKAVLREIARRRIGERVASGAKRGFGIPVQRWMAGRWRDRFVEMMTESVLEREGFIRSAPLAVCMDEAVKNRWAPNQLWYLCVLENWMRRESEAGIAKSATELSGRLQ